MLTSRVGFHEAVLLPDTAVAVATGVAVVVSEADVTAATVFVPVSVTVPLVWHSSPDWQTSATVTEHIHRLRGKLERDATRSQLIVTVGKSGYRFDPRDD